jgi:hypothetical protein
MLAELAHQRSENINRATQIPRARGHANGYRVEIVGTTGVERTLIVHTGSVDAPW